MPRRIPIVGVMGSGSRGHRRLARPLGELIATRGWHLLTGGGGGVMEEASRAFCAVPERRGHTIGIARSDRLPHLDEDTGRRPMPARAPNEWVEIPIQTHLPLSSEAVESRNHINVLSSDALVALPGGSGTLSEVRLRLQYGRRVILYLGDPAEGLRIGGRSAAELAREAEPGRVAVASTLEEAERCIVRHLSHPPG